MRFGMGMKQAPMNTVPEEWSFLKTAWRFAFLLTGCEEGAAKVFQESVEEILRHPHRGDEERMARLFFQIIRRRALKFPARCELTGLLAKLHASPEPGRSAVILLALNALSEEHLRHLLDVDKRTLADAVERTRAALGAPVEDELRSFPLSPEAEVLTDESAHALATHRGAPVHFARNPTLLAVALAGLLIVGVLVWQLMGRVGTFPEEALKVAKTAEFGRPDLFDPVEAKAGALEDWFMLKGFENFRVPSGFEDFEIVGVRIFRMENEPVAVAAAVENHMFFYVFRGAPLGIHVLPEKTWRITSSDRLVMAIREENDRCFMIVFRGTKEEMKALLKKTGN